MPSLDHRSLNLDSLFSPASLDNAIKKAKKAGNQFNNQLEDIIRKGEYLSMAEHLCLFDNWDHNTVKDRSRNIMECAWEELSKNIDF